MSRIVWVGNPPWSPSGYGEQAQLFLPRFQQLGHHVAVAANYGLSGTTTQWNGIPIYPHDGEWGNKALATYTDHFQADYAICLHDAWVMRPDDWPDHLPVAIWAPVDHYPIPPKVLAVLQHPRVRPIAMSRFGEDWMRRCKLDPLYVPHAVDTSMFRPQPDVRDRVRDALDVPRDAFLVGMVAANAGWSPQLPRKAFPQAFEAFARLAKHHQDAWMYVHAKALPAAPGMNLETCLLATGAMAGIDLEQRVRWPAMSMWHLGFGRQSIADLYSAFDVLLNPSMGEGFGVPILEAQACGVPVIASNHSAMIELTQAGWLVDGDPWWDALQESFAFLPAVGSIHRALEAAYDARDDQQLRAAAVRFAQGYAVDTVLDTYWRPVLDQLGKPREIPPLTPSVAAVNGNRAQRRAAKRRKAAV